ncbi:MAG: response regulator transcription factor [Spirochaetales bacterium]|nr:response regulator transcription factor [Spirochaetales bacterium]
MGKVTILVVEDDASIVRGLTDLLSSEGYSVHAARNGREALERYRELSPTLILLDLMMPEKSGYEVCRTIRKSDEDTPIIMLTAKGEETDKVVGLELGADDYIVKPFGIQELLARVRAHLRRAQTNGAKKTKKKQNDIPFSFGDVHIDPKTFIAQKGKKEFKLSAREVFLLQYFYMHEGEVLDRNELLDEVWGIQYAGTTRTLDQHIAKLRQKIEDDPAAPKHILTVHTIGYKFEK